MTTRWVEESFDERQAVPGCSTLWTAISAEQDLKQTRPFARDEPCRSNYGIQEKSGKEYDDEKQFEMTTGR